METALDALGPNLKRGCSIPGQGGRTYWQQDANGDPKETSDFSKDVLDEKALNWFRGCWRRRSATSTADVSRRARRSWAS
jgi:hypothetical protein